MADTRKRRCSRKTIPAQQGIEDQSDIEIRNPFDPKNTSDTSGESDVSEYGKRRRKAVHKKKKSKLQNIMAKPVRALSPPEMSSIEYDSDSDSARLGDYIEARNPTSPPHHSVLGATPLTSQTQGAGATPTTSGLPAAVQIHLNAGGAAGGTTINLDISDLVRGTGAFDKIGSAPSATPDGSTTPTPLTRITINHKTGQIRSATPRPSSKRIRMLEAIDTRMLSSGWPKKGFCDIPYEIRVRIYRQVFVTEAPLNLASRDNFARSSAFLRTCQLVHREGRAILYSENAFHFERSAGTRGKFFESTWKEIGFKDARRFLETIGSANIAMMRYLSFHFQDAARSTTPHLDENERRFVNDPILHYVLKLIGANACLSKIAFQFSGRRHLQGTDYNFLQALSSIKSEEVIHAERMTYAPSKVGDKGIVEKLKKVMTIAQADGAEIDIGKKRATTVRMFHERPRSFDNHPSGW